MLSSYLERAPVDMPTTGTNTVVPQSPTAPEGQDISLRRRVRIRWRWPSLPRLVVNYPAFFVLRDDVCDAETARLVWKRNKRR